MSVNEIDLGKLRRDRLKKIQSAMIHKNIGALLLTNPVNIRYATGTTCMTLWTSVNLARYALVPVEGDPIVFEYGKALHLTQRIWPNSRPAKYWQYRFSQPKAVESAKIWAQEIKGQMHEWGIGDSRLAIDTLDFYGFEALKAQGLVLTDSDEPMEDAKLVKTEAEIQLLKQSCAIGDAALNAIEEKIVPGVTENELYAAFWEKLIALGGEYCSTRLLCAGERTNPWFHEASDHIVRPGDLVGIDTDMTGPQGYLCDISRTFLCGEKATSEQKEGYRVAYDFVNEMVAECKVGTAYADLIERAPKYSSEYEKLGYSCMIHGSGFDDEPPFIPYPHDLKKGSLVPEGELLENMVLSVEFYAGKVGARNGVKLEEQIHVTSEGPVLLSRYPFEAKML